MAWANAAVNDLRLEIYCLEVERDDSAAKVIQKRQRVEQLRRELLRKETDNPGKLARVARLAVERMVLCGCKSPALKRLQRHELEALARLILDPAGRNFEQVLADFRRGGGDRLKRSAAHRLKIFIRDAVLSVVERRPLERSTSPTPTRSARE